MPSSRLYVFFDGKCPFCIGWVKFLIDRDGADCFRFASLQSEWTQDFFRSKGLPPPDMGSILVWDGETLYDQSDAIIRLASAMNGVWKGLAVLGHLPENFRDRAYDFIGERRYQWFGRREACWLPNNTEKRKFLDLEDPVYKTTPHGNQAEKD